MGLSFGARLRSQREQKQVTLRAIAEDTKIKMSLLEGLERDDLSYWPEGLFRRAYVRSYAKAIGLDPETVVREFLQVHPEPVEVDPIGAVAASKAGLLPSVVPHMFRRETPREAPVARARTAEPPRVVAPARVEPRVLEVAEPLAVADLPLNIAEEVVDTPDLPLDPVAELCIRLGRLEHATELPAVLESVTSVLDAPGLIVWTWDPDAAALRALHSSGYSDALVASLGTVPPDAPSAVAVAFRSGETRFVSGGDDLTGAIVVPMHGPAGCAGVLALETRNGREQDLSVRAVTTILAAQMVAVIGPAIAAEAVA
jgi:hypothetical protein